MEIEKLIEKEVPKLDLPNGLKKPRVQISY